MHYGAALVFLKDEALSRGRLSLPDRMCPTVENLEGRSKEEGVCSCSPLLHCSSPRRAQILFWYLRVVFSIRSGAYVPHA
nr:MAG TPA: hypothetical protein [Caudoviricetes sp.]